MCQELNRLTANFCSMMPQQPYRFQEGRNSFLTALERAIANLTGWLPGAIAPQALLYPADFSPPFVQLVLAVEHQRPFLPLPSLTAIAGEEKDTGSWPGFWAEITAGLTGLFAGMVSHLSQALTRLVESQPWRVSVGPPVDTLAGGGGILPAQSGVYTLAGGGGILLDTLASGGGILPAQLGANTIAGGGGILPTQWGRQSVLLLNTLASGVGILPAQGRGQPGRLSHEDLAVLHSSQTLHLIPLTLPLVKGEALKFPPLGKGRVEEGSMQSLVQALSSSENRYTRSILDSAMFHPFLSSLGFSFPNPQVPELGMPEFSPPVPALAQMPQRPTAGPLPVRVQVPPEMPAGPSPIHFNGGIHVQIAAQTVDPDHAEETARRIAGHVLREINRIMEQDRFRRGLPPSTLPYP